MPPSTPAAFCAPRLTTVFCSMANPKRVQALLALADEDLGAARILLGFSMRTARYHVQQSAEKAVKALLEHRGINPGREHRFELLAEMLPEGDPWRSRIQSLDELSPAAFRPGACSPESGRRCRHGGESGNQPRGAWNGL